MSKVPAELRYAKSHEWLKPSPDGTALVGITDYAQNSLGDITFVQLPKPGTVLRVGDSFGVVESVKAASDIYAPVACSVLEANESLNNSPEIVNKDPYGSGWMLKVKVSNPSDVSALLDAAAYEASLG